ncbi:hypothetical protein NEOKW01_1842 [Nematocida sp. AWRm80]|nr:hypothetical protein NEOKW01_1842 [Nematocida sp. AWRm80]
MNSVKERSQEVYWMTVLFGVLGGIFQPFSIATLHLRRNHKGTLPIVELFNTAINSIEGAKKRGNFSEETGAFIWALLCNEILARFVVLSPKDRYLLRKDFLNMYNSVKMKGTFSAPGRNRDFFENLMSRMFGANRTLIEECVEKEFQEEMPEGTAKQTPVVGSARCLSLRIEEISLSDLLQEYARIKSENTRSTVKNCVGTWAMARELHRRLLLEPHPLPLEKIALIFELEELCREVAPILMSTGGIVGKHKDNRDEFLTKLAKELITARLTIADLEDSNAVTIRTVLYYAYKHSILDMITKLITEIDSHGSPDQLITAMAEVHRKAQENIAQRRFSVFSPQVYKIDLQSSKEVVREFLTLLGEEIPIAQREKTIQEIVRINTALLSYKAPITTKKLSEDHRVDELSVMESITKAIEEWYLVYGTRTQEELLSCDGDENVFIRHLTASMRLEYMATRWIVVHPKYLPTKSIQAPAEEENINSTESRYKVDKLEREEKLRTVSMIQAMIPGLTDDMMARAAINYLRTKCQEQNTVPVELEHPSQGLKAIPAVSISTAAEDQTPEANTNTSTSSSTEAQSHLEDTRSVTCVLEQIAELAEEKETEKPAEEKEPQPQEQDQQPELDETKACFTAAQATLSPDFLQQPKQVYQETSTAQTCSGCIQPDTAANPSKTKSTAKKSSSDDEFTITVSALPITNTSTKSVAAQTIQNSQSTPATPSTQNTLPTQNTSSRRVQAQGSSGFKGMGSKEKILRHVHEYTIMHSADLFKKDNRIVEHSPLTRDQLQTYFKKSPYMCMYYNNMPQELKDSIKEEQIVRLFDNQFTEEIAKGKEIVQIDSLVADAHREFFPPGHHSHLIEPIPNHEKYPDIIKELVRLSVKAKFKEACDRKQKELMKRAAARQNTLFKKFKRFIRPVTNIFSMCSGKSTDLDQLFETWRNEYIEEVTATTKISHPVYPPVAPGFINVCAALCNLIPKSTEGTFRIAPAKVCVKTRYREYIEENKPIDYAAVGESPDEIKALAMVFKWYIRNYNNGIISGELSHAILCRLTTQNTQEIDYTLGLIVASLLNSNAIWLLMHVVYTIEECAKHEKTNKMSYNSILNMVAPNLLAPEAQTSIESIDVAIEVSHSLFAVIRRMYFIKDTN